MLNACWSTGDIVLMSNNVFLLLNFHSVKINFSSNFKDSQTLVCKRTKLLGVSISHFIRRKSSQYLHWSPSCNACNEIQDVGRNEMDENCGNLEKHQTWQEFQVRIPNSGFQWIHVQQFVCFLDDFVPFERIVSWRRAVEHWQFSWSLLRNVVSRDENLIDNYIHWNVIVNQRRSNWQTTNDAFACTHQEALRSILADCPTCEVYGD